MPDQTTISGNIYFPDGAQVLHTPYGGAQVDLGVLMGDIGATLTYSENQVQTANKGTTQMQIKNMAIDLNFTLATLDPDKVANLGGGIFETVDTAGGSVSSIDDQVIASGGATELTAYPLVITETGSLPLRVSASLVIASVTGSTDGALAANDDYTIIDDPNAYSGKSIVFNTAGSTLTTMAQTITIAYTSVTPVARTTVFAGNTTELLSPGQLTIRHTDENSLVRELNLFSVNPTSGGFQFNFKGAGSDGLEEMPITIKGTLDTSLTNGRQLMSWIVDSGAA